MPPALELDLRGADAHRRLLAKVQELAAGLALPAAHVPAVAPAHDEGLATPTANDRNIVTTGYVALGTTADARTCEDLVTLIDRLLEAGLPAVFMFVTDAAMALGERLERSVSALLGEAYVVIEDVWAWRIARGTSGWAPHRGVSTLLDRSRPELVNTWVALSAVPENRACMHFIPLDDDPRYPDELQRTDFNASAVRPAPLAAGGALGWNANVLHWGGRCAPDADGPRVSCSFSLERRDATSSTGSVLTRDPTARIDLVAGQIATYGQGQPDVSPEILEWARATCALRAHFDAFTRKER
ncbi:MAG TPA: phytanoyl-CoA dioxygenase family protein [Labilithrix sp.]|jgi:hypothetical protein|nr:phytanoyl-CoA dioxygenase family protein [Labilithrix sp.]